MRKRTLLDPRKKYLQVAFNSTLEDAKSIIHLLPKSDRIIVEAGTPFIKRYGMDGIRQLRAWSLGQLWSSAPIDTTKQEIMLSLPDLFRSIRHDLKTGGTDIRSKKIHLPYIVADLKTMDRGDTEVSMVAEAGASAAIALGSAPVETLNAFIASCEAHRIDAMIDMMNVEYPLAVLHALKRPPPIVILHRGVDEERDNREKQLPLHEIRRIKGAFDIMISIAGGDTQKEIQRAVFNDADIVVIWKAVYHNSNDTIALIEGFLKDIK